MTVALDEIQYIPNLPSVVKYLYDHYGIKFLLTGSSSFYLKKYFSESMAGRKIVYELFPLRFGEFLDFRGVPYRIRTTIEDMVFDQNEYERLRGYYDEYVSYGGLPSVVLEPRAEVKREILQDIFSSYINIDVQAMADFRKIKELQELIKALVLRIGNKLDLAKLAQIIGISRPTLNEYLEFLERTYLIHQLPAYAGTDKTISLGKKLYFRDNGIASALANPGDGALFENAVFNQLWAYGRLAYLTKGNDYEVDFILDPQIAPPVALEVKYHPVESDAKKLKKIALRHGFERYWIIGKHPTHDFHYFVWGGSIY
jgi:predicted AAA+ superfamily ATPase